MIRRIEKSVLVFLIIVFGALCIVSFIRNLYPFRYKIWELSSDGVLWVFEEHFDEFDEAAEILWNHRDFFEHIHEPYGDWRISDTSNTTIDYENYDMFFTDEEWDKVRSAYFLLQPIYFSMGAHFINTYSHSIVFYYVLNDENGNLVDVSFYYMDCHNYEPGDFYFMEAIRDMKAYYENVHGTELKNILSPNWYYVVKYRS